MNGLNAYPLEEALKAQQALRKAAGLGEEQFPIEAFVGMISDEIDCLRQRGASDSEIAAIVSANSAIVITAGEIAAHYAEPGLRHAAGSAEPRRV